MSMLKHLKLGKVYFKLKNFLCKSSPKNKLLDCKKSSASVNLRFTEDLRLTISTIAKSSVEPKSRKVVISKPFSGLWASLVSMEIILFPIKSFKSLMFSSQLTRHVFDFSH